MKFVTLALAILLAVGCQAASLQADAPALPSYVEHARAGVKLYLERMKDAADKFADEVKNNPETAELGEKIKTRTEEFYNSLIAFQVENAPKTDSVVAVIDEATREMRNAIYADVEQLQETLKPMQAELRKVIDKHVEEYKQTLETFKQNNLNEWQDQMTTWKNKVMPVMENLREKITTNVEETKTKITPIVESVSAKISERLQKLREAAEPYVLEYKEQLKQAYEQAQAGSMNQYTEKLTPHLESVKTSFNNLINEVKAMAGQ